MIPKLLIIPIILTNLIALCSATKLASCSGIYGPTFSSRIKPFINVTLESSYKHGDLNYTTLIFHYPDIKNSNIPQLENFELTNELKICGEKEVQNRECKEPGKFVVNYRESESRIYNEVLNFEKRAYLEYPVMETGMYCVYVQTSEDGGENMDQVDVKFQQPYGYLSYVDILNFTILTTIQLPIVTLLLLFIAGRFIYVRMFQKKEVSLIQKAIFHYTYLVYLKTFAKFLRLWIINSINVEISTFAALISLLLITLSDVLDSITWGLILIISHGFGTLYDKSTFPRGTLKKIMLFMASNFVIRMGLANNLTSNIQVLNKAGSVNAVDTIHGLLHIFGFFWVVRSFYKTAKEISMYFDLTTSKLFKRSGLIVFLVPIVMNVLTVVLAIVHLLKKYSDTTIDPIDFQETSWYDSAYTKILILPNLANFVSIILLLYIWDNVDSQKVDEDNVAEFGAPAVGEVTLGKNDEQN